MTQVVNVTDDHTFEPTPWWVSPKAKTPVTFPDDPVALSVASYNFWKRTDTGRWMDFEMVKVTPEDREQAIALKKYYRDRLVFEALKGNGEQVSEFRQKLRQLVTDELVITQSEIGMLYRLPYFYDEDLAVDRVIAQTKSVSVYLQGSEETATYTLIEKVLRSRRSGEYYDYWMKSDRDSSLYLAMVKNDNPLRIMFDSIISKPVKLHTKVWTKQHRGYYKHRAYQQITVQGIAND